MYLKDTIVAISTPFGESGIGIVRTSGKESFKIAKSIFRPFQKKKFSQLKDHSINYGWIFDPKNKNIVDEVLLSILKAPRTYTREDMIEINCHGGWLTLKNTLDLVISFGARLANPGEFTLRAFLNGRIDLTQAEAVLDIIRARNDLALKASLHKLKGNLKDKILLIRDEIIAIKDEINAEIDFFIDLDVEKKKSQKKRLENIIASLNKTLESSIINNRLNSSIKIAFCGKTNVGKSSLINKICNNDRILVSKIPGTTRDCIDVDLFIDGICYNLIDTAGIRKCKGYLEGLSIEKTRKEIKNSDIIILIFDLSRQISKNDNEIIDTVIESKISTIFVTNKNDLKRRLDKKSLIKLINSKTINVSAKNGNGIKILKKEISFLGRKFFKNLESKIILNEREIILLFSILDNLKKAVKILSNNLNQELIIENLNMAIENMDKLHGKCINNDDINNIFNKFCIGK